MYILDRVFNITLQCKMRVSACNTCSFLISLSEHVIFSIKISLIKSVNVGFI